MREELLAEAARSLEVFARELLEISSDIHQRYVTRQTTMLVQMAHDLTKLSNNLSTVLRMKGD